MKGFIVDLTYRLKDKKAFVHFYGRLENGESFLTINEAKPYFFIKKTELKKAQDILNAVQKKYNIEFSIEETKMRDFQENQVAKIIVDVPPSVPLIRKEFEQAGIACYEADIRFVYRMLIDKNILGCIDIDGGYTTKDTTKDTTMDKSHYVKRVYEEPKITPAVMEPKLTVLSFDIETNMKANTIFSIAIVAKNYHENKTKNYNLIFSNKPVKNATHFATEKEMLVAFLEKVKEIDPDIITGWNVVDFDCRILRERCKYHKIPFILGRGDEETKVRIESQFFKDSTVSIAGRQVLDGIALLRNSFIKLDDYKLETAAKALLGKTKALDFMQKDSAGKTKGKGAIIEELFAKEPEVLVNYNEKDAELVLEILEAKDIINLAVQRSMLTGMQIDRVSASIASLDSLYIRETKNKGYVCNSSSYSETAEKIKGGFVRDSIPGIYSYIIVCDFKSLYPSIIRTFNVDPLSFQKDGTIVAPNGARFRDEDGILSSLIQRLWEQRDNAKKRKDSVASYAIKITMNSFFGVLASPMCRFYSLDMAGAITGWGQEIVKETAEEVEKLGYTVIYGDTDSIFIETKKDSVVDSEKIGREITQHINSYFKKKIKEKYNRTSFLELEFEKIYKTFIMPKIRGTEQGAKKRYAGLLTDGREERIDIVGMETVRRDWTECAKLFQGTLLKKIFAKEEVAAYIKRFVEDVKSGKYDALLIYKKALGKEVEYYTKTTPPHVKAARQLDSLESNIIEYYVTVNGPEPLQKLKSKIDYEHYINKQLKPIADSLLIFFNLTFDEIISGKKQKSLWEY